MIKITGAGWVLLAVMIAAVFAFGLNVGMTLTR